MIGALIRILVAVLILGLLYYIVTLLPLPAPFAQIARIVAIVICLLVLLALLWYTFPMHPLLRC
ncbi:hypothetical protein [Burkholderia pseudomallei]|uniref:hypothetical protein n=1 Tax=Burkholderia pseudomallei TaxID=28450 RepID=UPI000A1A1CF2|nr:hypothetical protein [Burkholderia pseudomallei]ARL77590.1 hypothetical protein BOC54_36955 [Burkholderia pseudomallei]ARL84195.1 hypothetical protein BOC55_35280 [Burkholderia pseudomallei]